MSSTNRSKYARATLEYDDEHERALLDAIIRAILEASMVSDCNAMVVRTGEAARALTKVLAMVLVLSPSVTRSPTAIRKVADGVGKQLRRYVAEAEGNGDVQEFARRTFRDGGTEGSA